MTSQSKPVAGKPVYILTGSSTQYTEARRKLDLLPSQALWLTRSSDLKGKQNPKVFRFGDWKSLPRIQEIEEALNASQAEISDLD